MLETYVPWWFRHYGLYVMGRVFFMEQNYERVANQEAAHPGFAGELRRFALELLGAAEDEHAVRRALSALAVVGSTSDLAAVRAVGEARGGTIQKDAGAAAYEIEHRAAPT